MESVAAERPAVRSIAWLDLIGGALWRIKPRGHCRRRTPAPVCEKLDRDIAIVGLIGSVETRIAVAPRCCRTNQLSLLLSDCGDDEHAVPTAKLRKVSGILQRLVRIFEHERSNEREAKVISGDTPLLDGALLEWRHEI